MENTIQIVQLDQRDLISKLKEAFKQEILQLIKPIEELEIYTPKEVCKIFKIDNSTLWRWTEKGKLPVYGIGHKRYFKKQDLELALIPLSNTRVVSINNLNPAA